MQVTTLAGETLTVKVAIVPLLKNKEALTNRARELHRKLQRRYAVFFDESGAAVGALAEGDFI